MGDVYGDDPASRRFHHEGTKNTKDTKGRSISFVPSVLKGPRNQMITGVGAPLGAADEFRLIHSEER